MIWLKFIFILLQTHSEEKGNITSCAETKSKGDRVVISLQGKELLTFIISIVRIDHITSAYDDIQNK